MNTIVKHVTYCNIVRWWVLFRNEGTVSGETRHLYDSWFRLLVEMALHHPNTRGMIFLLMQARLAVEDGKISESEMEELFHDFRMWRPIVPSDSNQERFLLVCQFLNLCPEDVEKFRLSSFKKL